MGSFDEVVPAVLPDAADDLRTPFEILTPQLLGYHLSVGVRPEPGQSKSGRRHQPRSPRGQNPTRALDPLLAYQGQKSLRENFHCPVPIGTDFAGDLGG